MNIKGLIMELELFIEMKELKEIGLTEEEIFGYVDMYLNSWIEKKLFER